MNTQKRMQFCFVVRPDDTERFRKMYVEESIVKAACIVRGFLMFTGMHPQDTSQAIEREEIL